MKTRGESIGMAKVSCVLVLTLVILAGPVEASLTGLLTTADGGLVANGDWQSPPNGEGFQIRWTISQNQDQTWHYKYELLNESGESLEKTTSHFILPLSTNIEEDDLYNFSGDAATWEFGTFGPASGNPGFPEGETIFGVKIDLGLDQGLVEFDATRQPMWGDFYAKDGRSGEVWSYAYSSDFGTEVANPHDYMGTPVDGNGVTLHKILTPDTYIPEPCTVILVGIAAVLALRRRRV